MFAVSLLLACLSVPGFPTGESSANYQIEVFLNSDSAVINSTIEIEFTNGTEFSVDTLWLHLYPNAYSNTNTAFATDLEEQGNFSFRRSDEEDRGIIELSNFTLNGSSIDIVIDETLGYIVLETPVESGDTVHIAGEFTVKVPKFWSRMGHSENTFEITQWYPKMCVLDKDGWHRSRYHAMGEFYSDYGRYEIAINVPASFITAATGVVINTAYSADSLRRTDLWFAENVHDFAWSSSSDYTIRTHEFIYRETNDSVDVHLVLLDDSEDHWSTIPEAVDSTLAYFGEWYMQYPYTDLWVIEPASGSSGGMEYPQFVFGYSDVPFTRALEMVVIHEVGHQWFYGLLGTNETEEAWLDEGMNTFSELRYMERKYGFLGNMTTTPDWLLCVSDRDLQGITYASSLSDDITPVISTATDAGNYSYSSAYTYYTKPALFLSMLQVQLGEELFDDVMKIYFERFALHHPKTEDFQAIVEELTGRSWQIEFDFWLRNLGSADIRLSEFDATTEVSSVVITADIPHEMLVPILFTSGDDSLMVSIVLSPNSEEEIVVVAPGEWEKAIADPFLRIPDSAPWNNTAPISFEFKPFLPIPKTNQNSIWILPYVGYADNSWQAKALFLATPLPVENGGPFTFISSFAVPFKESSSGSFGMSLAVPVSRSYRETAILKSTYFSGYGINKISSIITWKKKGSYSIEPYHSATFAVELLGVSDTSVYGEENVEIGNNLEVQSGLKYYRRQFNRTVRTEMAMFVAPGIIGSFYSGLNLDMNYTQRYNLPILLSTRLNFSGRLGDVPLQRRVRPGGGLFPNSAISLLAPPDGTLSTSNHYFVRSGPALPGYCSSTVRGKAGFSIEQRLSNSSGLFGIFGGAGWVGSSFEELIDGSLISNAGLFIDFALIEAIFPIWVSDPEPDEAPWAFRWRMEINL